MRNLNVSTLVSLYGVIQAPGGSGRGELKLAGTRVLGPGAVILTYVR